MDDIAIRCRKFSQLLIVKKDRVTGAPLAGVEFRVTDSNDGVIGASDGLFVTDSAGTIHTAVTVCY